MAQQHPLFNPRESAPGSYRELYMTAGYQKGGPVPARLMASYRFTEALGGGERPTPANLKEQTLALSERRPVAFLCLYRKTGATNVEVRILHRMLRYYELPGDKAGGEAADLSMGLLGEVRAAQIPVVEVDNSLFSLIGGAIRVPTVAVMPELLAQRHRAAT
ncbi:hypothetical protein MHU86_1973 [Fragilaria crotonensis]|nr:hypothetical protein MHU86_1973 [Fragilaria crotonensis]